MRRVLTTVVALLVVVAGVGLTARAGYEAGFDAGFDEGVVENVAGAEGAETTIIRLGDDRRTGGPGALFPVLLVVGGLLFLGGRRRRAAWRERMAESGHDGPQPHVRDRFAAWHREQHGDDAGTDPAWPGETVTATIVDEPLDGSPDEPGRGPGPDRDTTGR